MKAETRKMMEETLIRMLNRSLRFRGVYDVDVVGLSADLRTAFIKFRQGGRDVAKGAVPAEALLGE